MCIFCKIFVGKFFFTIFQMKVASNDLYSSREVKLTLFFWIQISNHLLKIYMVPYLSL